MKKFVALRVKAYNYLTNNNKDEKANSTKKMFHKKTLKIINNV